MRVGLYNLEPKIYNTALMQVASYHKQRGNVVEWYNHFIHDTYDLIYAFSLFTWTDKGYVSDNMIVGGTGFDPKIQLPSEIAKCDLDYSMYPTCKTSFLWFSRGCIRSCPFCCITEKEGYLYSVEPKNLNPHGEYVSVMDNSFFANPDWEKAILFLKDTGQPVLIEQGIDVRIITDIQLSKFAELPYLDHKIRFAWDNPKEDLMPNIKRMLNYFSARNLTCYVLIGYWSNPQEDQDRVEALRSLGINPFVMPYNPKDKYQKAYARYVNHKAIFKSVSWKEYATGKKGIMNKLHMQPEGDS